MKTANQHQHRNIAILMLAGTLGLLLLMHVTSARKQRCAGETFDISLIKLI